MKVYFFLALLCCFCSSNKTTTSAKFLCNENMSFKELFIGHIKIVDDFMLTISKPYLNLDDFERAVTVEKVTEFESSLRFISKYTHVSFDSMLNYDKSYPYVIYEKDKVGWLKWYEENKCNAIQFK